MDDVNISTLTRTAQPRAKRLRGIAGGGVAAAASASIVSGYLNRALADTLYTPVGALANYLPLSGGTLSGPLTVKVNNAALSLLNAAGNGVRLELNTAADLITAYPAGSTAAVTFRASTLWADKRFALSKGADIYDDTSGGRIYFDEEIGASGAWVFNRPIVCTGDVTAFASV